MACECKIIANMQAMNRGREKMQMVALVVPTCEEISFNTGLITGQYLHWTLNIYETIMFS